MAEFHIPYIAQLSYRLGIAPPKARSKYVRRIRQLLQELKGDRDYPFDYIRYRILGYCIDQDTGQCFAAEKVRADLDLLLSEIQPLGASRQEDAGVPSPSAPASDLEPEPAYYYETIFDEKDSDVSILRAGGAACQDSGSGILTAAAEVDLFRCYNYCKYQVTRLTRVHADSPDRSEVVERVNFYKRIALVCRNRMIEANLGLVRRVVRLHLGKNFSYEELVSEGNNSLMRAVENFDYLRKNRFSTYATWVVVKNFARTIPRENELLKTFRTDQEGFFADTEEDAKKTRTRLLPGLWKTIEEALEKLPEKERIAVTYFFGVNGAPISLKNIAPMLGLTSKEIVRRYKDRGLRRLQQIVNAELYEQIYS
ncbi:MAG: sigma-70 family RNA polymerase sigma factor [Planctomycetes bacterium]|nr:sigma-70 family RNA polymerase sigma factor [Planctomycetota bacterium]